MTPPSGENFDCLEEASDQQGLITVSLVPTQLTQDGNDAGVEDEEEKNEQLLSAGSVITNIEKRSNQPMTQARVCGKLNSIKEE